MVRVKICGVNSAESFAAAAEAGAEFVGFVFFPASPRFVTPEQAASLAAGPAGPLRVGLFVEPAEAEIARVLDRVRLDVLQLYAAPARAAELGLRFGLPVWRTAGVRERADLPATAEGAAALVIEPRPPPGASRPGGRAEALDWAMLGGWRPGFDWVLAGGLRPETVGQAIAASGAACVDVSSGVETAPGVKSPALIRAFIRAARLPPASAPGYHPACPEQRA